MILLSLLLGLSGCDVSVKAGDRELVNTGGQNKKESFEYDFTQNNCPTGKKSFSSRDAMCDALKNDDANNFCARELRYEYFKTNCQDKSWTH